MHKILPLIAAASLFAKTDSAKPNICCDKPPKCVNRNINPSARNCNMQKGRFIALDFIYWQPDDSGSAYAFVQTDPVQSNIGDLKRSSMRWAPGYKASLGWDTPYDGWDVGLSWTGYWSHSKNRLDARYNTVSAISLPTALTTFSRAANAKCAYHLLYNMGNLEFGRDFFVSNTLSLRPFAGGRGGWYYRDRSIRATGSSTSSGDLINFHSSMETHYWGVGPRIGLNTDWDLACGFKVFGNLATSLLYGKVNSKASSTQVVFPSTQLAGHINDTYWHVVPNLNLFTGFSWGRCFDCDTIYLGVRVGWEFECYWNQPPFLFANGASNLQNSPDYLSLSGLTIDFRSEF